MQSTHCEAVGRDYDEIEKTALGSYDPSQSTAEFIAMCKELADIGITHLIFNMNSYDDVSVLSDAFAKEIIPAVAEL